MPVKCSVPYCKYLPGPKVHSTCIFPKDDTLFKIWVQAVNNKTHRDKTKEYIRKAHRVCMKHFEEKYHQTNRGEASSKPLLLPGAVPTLYLYNNEFEPPDKQEVILDDIGPDVVHNYSIPGKENIPDKKSDENKSKNSGLDNFVPPERLLYQPDKNKEATKKALPSEVVFVDNPGETNEESQPKIMILSSDKKRKCLKIPRVLKQYRRKSLNSADNTDALSENLTWIWSNVAEEAQENEVIKPNILCEEIKPICCICVKNQENLINIFDLHGDTTYYEKLKTTYTDMVFETDDVYNQICQKCSENLFQAYEFREICKNSAERMKRFKETGMVEGEFKEREKEIVETEKSGIESIVTVEDTPMENSIENLTLEDHKYDLKMPENIDPTLYTMSFWDKIKKLEEKIEKITEAIPKATNNKNLRYKYSRLFDLKSKLQYTIKEREKYLVAHECKTCGLRFANLKEIADHRIQVHKVRALKFRIPKSSLTNLPKMGWALVNSEKKVFFKSSRSFSNKKLYKCDQCDKIFLKHSQLRTHRAIHTKERIYLCELCGAVKNTEAKLQEHLLLHTGEKPYKCELCDRCFRIKYSLKNHVEYAHTTEIAICDQCGKVTKNKVALQTHMKIHSKNHRQQVFNCTMCTRTFKGKTGLQIHIRSHTNELPYACDLCDKRFNTRGQVKRHKIVNHLKLKPFKCNQCDRAFSFHHSLRYHLQTHSGILPFACEICDKRFTRKIGLEKHVNHVHHDLRLYECDICNYKLKQISHLTRHKQTHLKCKFSCPDCVRLFPTNEKLLKHTQNVHMVVAFKCDDCLAGFTTQEAYAAHKCDSVCPICHKVCANGYLSRHMKLHKVETKSVEEVIIEDQDMPEIDLT